MLILSGSDDLYAFIPSLRRYQPVSSLARQTAGMDFTPDDYRSGFDANLTQMKVDYLGEKKLLALVLSDVPGKYPDAYDMSLGLPKPSWGKWQLRDVYVVSASKLPKYARGYCYGKCVMYIDRSTFSTYWEECTIQRCGRGKLSGCFSTRSRCRELV